MPEGLTQQDPAFVKEEELGLDGRKLKEVTNDDDADAAERRVCVVHDFGEPPLHEFHGFTRHHGDLVDDKEPQVTQRVPQSAQLLATKRTVHDPRSGSPVTSATGLDRQFQQVVEGAPPNVACSNARRRRQGNDVPMVLTTSVVHADELLQHADDEALAGACPTSDEPIEGWRRRCPCLAVAHGGTQVLSQSIKGYPLMLTQAPLPISELGGRHATTWSTASPRLCQGGGHHGLISRVARPTLAAPSIASVVVAVHEVVPFKVEVRVICVGVPLRTWPDVIRVLPAHVPKLLVDGTWSRRGIDSFVLLRKHAKAPHVCVQLVSEAPVRHRLHMRSRLEEALFEAVAGELLLLGAPRGVQEEHGVVVLVAVRLGRHARVHAHDRPPKPLPHMALLSTDGEGMHLALCTSGPPPAVLPVHDVVEQRKAVPRAAKGTGGVVLVDADSDCGLLLVLPDGAAALLVSHAPAAEGGGFEDSRAVLREAHAEFDDAARRAVQRLAHEGVHLLLQADLALAKDRRADAPQLLVGTAAGRERCEPLAHRLPNAASLCLGHVPGTIRRRRIAVADELNVHIGAPHSQQGRVVSVGEGVARATLGDVRVGTAKIHVGIGAHARVLLRRLLRVPKTTPDVGPLARVPVLMLLHAQHQVAQVHLSWIIADGRDLCADVSVNEGRCITGTLCRSDHGSVSDPEHGMDAGAAADLEFHAPKEVL